MNEFATDALIDTEYDAEPYRVTPAALFHSVRIAGITFARALVGMSESKIGEICDAELHDDENTQRMRAPAFVVK